MERGGQGGRRRVLARLLRGEGGGATTSRTITFYIVSEPPDNQPDLECEEVCPVGWHEMRFFGGGGGRGILIGLYICTVDEVVILKKRNIFCALSLKNRIF